MTDFNRRDASLDLIDEDLHALLAGVTALMEQEVGAARSGPVYERPPSAAEVDRMVGADRTLPADGESVEALLAACAAVLAAGRRTTPTFFGYVQSPPAPVGIAADLLASAADQNLTSWRSTPSAVAVEHQTLRWLGEFVGFDAAATGILVSGGSAANLTALLVAMRAVTGPDDDRRSMRVYASADTHFSVAKAAATLGVGFAPVAVDRDRRLDPAALRRAIAADRAAGLVPVCIVANAGTTSTGAVDPLDAVATVAAEAGRLAACGRRVRGARCSRSRLSAALRRPAASGLAVHRRAQVALRPGRLQRPAVARRGGHRAGLRRRRRRLRAHPRHATGGDVRVLGPRTRAQPPLPGPQVVGDAPLPRRAPARGRDRRGRPGRHPPRRARRGRRGLRAPRRPGTEHLLLSARAAAPRRRDARHSTTSGSWRRCSTTAASTCRTRPSADASLFGPASRTSAPHGRTSSGC